MSAVTRRQFLTWLLAAPFMPAAARALPVALPVAAPGRINKSWQPGVPANRIDLMLMMPRVDTPISCRVEG